MTVVLSTFPMEMTKKCKTCGVGFSKHNKNSVTLTPAWIKTSYHFCSIECALDFINKDIDEEEEYRLSGKDLKRLLCIKEK